MRRFALLALGASLTIGCEPGDEYFEPLPEVIDSSFAKDGTEIVTFRTIVDNGTVGNGFEWNGLRWNGLRWNGTEINSATVTSVTYDSTDGTFEALDDQSNPIALSPSDEFIAEGDHTDGTDTEVKVSEIEQFTGGVHNFQFQRVQTRVLPSGEWEDACLDGAGNPTKAILLKGDWESPEYSRITGAEADSATTWACRGAALAKCVEWGYHPEGISSSTPLSDHHQACTRMVRADYCGNGDHHTENGTPIDIEDSLGIQTHSSAWDIEAAWGPNGALCVNDPRKTWWTREAASIGCTLPTCGTDVAYWFGQGALFVTRNQPSALIAEEPADPDSGG